MRCLVTGGAGFIGFHLCSRLIQKYVVKVVDSFNPYYDVKLKEFNAQELKRLGVEVIQEDILNYNKISEVLKGIDVIIHLAAQPGVSYSINHLLEVQDINVGGTINLLEGARKNKISKFIFAGSSSIYGNCLELPIKETSPSQPISPYGLSKLIAEKYIEFYNRTYNLPTVTLRLFSVIGARQRPDMALHKFIQNILNDIPITVFGDGHHTRDWSNVKNVVDAFIKCIESSNVSGEVFNVGHGLKTSINEIIRILEKKIGKNIEISYQNKKPEDPINTQADISKISNKLGYKPKYSIEDAIESEIEFIRSWY